MDQVRLRMEPGYREPEWYSPDHKSDMQVVGAALLELAERIERLEKCAVFVTESD